MNILLAGGSGMIGAAVAADLRLRHHVRVLDPVRQAFEDVEWHQGSALDAGACARAVEGMDWILIKLGAMGGVPSFERPLHYHDLNVVGALRLIEAGRIAGVKNVHFDSSETVFGPSDAAPFTEEMMPHPGSVYGATKRLVECYLRSYEHRYGIRWAAFRYPRIIGKGTANIVARIKLAWKRGEPFVVRGNGSYVFDLVHVNDVVAAHRCLVDGRAPSGIFHISPGEGASVVGIARWVGDGPIRYVDAPVAETLTEEKLSGGRMVMDSRFTQSALGWSPMSLEESVRRSAATDL